jgi:hypothetical protein
VRPVIDVPARGHRDQELGESDGLAWTTQMPTRLDRYLPDMRRPSHRCVI